MSYTAFFHGGPLGGQIRMLPSPHPVYWAPEMERKAIVSLAERVSIKTWAITYRLVAQYGKTLHYNCPEREWTRDPESGEVRRCSPGRDL